MWPLSPYRVEGTPRRYLSSTKPGSEAREMGSWNIKPIPTHLTSTFSTDKEFPTKHHSVFLFTGHDALILERDQVTCVYAPHFCQVIPSYRKLSFQDWKLWLYWFPSYGPTASLIIYLSSGNLKQILPPSEPCNKPFQNSANHLAHIQGAVLSCFLRCPLWGRLHSNQIPVIWTNAYL